MFAILTLFAALGTTFAGYAGSSSNSVGNGYGYGFSGSYSGAGPTGQTGPIPHGPPFDFGGFFDQLRRYHDGLLSNGNTYSYSVASTSPDANAQAQSSITFIDSTGIQHQAQNVPHIPTRFGGGGGGGGGGGAGYDYSGYAAPSGFGSGSFGGGYGGGFSSVDGGAAASASIGPQGGHQAAAVYPENPHIPNVFNRFGESGPGGQGGVHTFSSPPQGGGGGGGSYGVFTSSVSSSSNLGGKPQSFHQASTTINDNGKVSTYTVRNP